MENSHFLGELEDKIWAIAKARDDHIEIVFNLNPQGLNDDGDDDVVKEPTNLTVSVIKGSMAQPHGPQLPTESIEVDLAPSENHAISVEDSFTPAKVEVI
ncbi:hypothetical protein JCGZ_23626 [Jatropha curcas]|uniref:Uncharacterized protein n=1 Tax=Jatropha curcas TaxID=180498 RepID=A0A067L2J7_JATCU|nr:hypothetical protein JCGZ_23626 [Jatropha curcas]